MEPLASMPASSNQIRANGTAWSTARPGSSPDIAAPRDVRVAKYRGDTFEWMPQSAARKD
jgi:hypothetical protein